MNLKKSAKALGTRVLDATLGRLVSYIDERVRRNRKPKNVIDVLRERALNSAADYVETNMEYAVEFKDRTQLWEFALSKIELDGIIAEFGVFDGRSINYFADRLASQERLIGTGTRSVRIFGFDSFDGLREDWRGHDLIKGAFSLGGKLPKVRDNVELIKGWFDITVPGFLDLHPGPFAFIHVDCDTYEANKSLLKLVGARLSRGTIIVFDEYFGYTGWRVGEWKAWQEHVDERGIHYEYLGFSIHQVAVRIL